jgi:outer membrane protein TolC
MTWSLPRRCSAAGRGVAGACVVVAVGLVAPGVSSAGPTLADFLTAARSASLDNREQDELVREREAAHAVDRAALWPSLSVSASYTRNQHEQVVRFPADDGGGLVEATLAPLDQLDATVQLDVPLLDVATRRRTAASQADLAASRAAARAGADEVERAVVRAYYQWVGGTALLTAGRGAERAAVDNLAVLGLRAGAGLAGDLYVARADAQLARSRQAIADAELAVASARRSLRTLSGLAPDGAAPALPDDAAIELPGETWLTAVDGLPTVESARSALAAQSARADADRAAWVPTVGAFARERLSNAAGFGESATWAVGVAASWRLDRGTLARGDRGRAAAAVGAVRAARAVQDARDAIVDAWQRVAALRARAAAAAAEARAAAVAARVATTRYRDGTATQLEVTLAQRDALDAEVALIQARADLAAARALLRLAAGREAVP